MINKIFPFRIDEIHENQLDCLIVTGEMLKDFGPWLKGRKLDLTFNFLDGEIIEYEPETGEEITKINFELKVKL